LSPLTCPRYPHMKTKDGLRIEPITNHHGRVVGWKLVDPPTLRDMAMTEDTKMHEGLPVHGYQPQSDDKVQMVNRMKQMEEMILRVLDSMRLDPHMDQRWLQIGRTGLEQAFMAINRSVFQPQRVTLHEDEYRGDMSNELKEPKETA